MRLVGVSIEQSRNIAKQAARLIPTNRRFIALVESGDQSADGAITQADVYDMLTEVLLEQRTTNLLIATLFNEDLDSFRQLAAQDT